MKVRLSGGFGDRTGATTTVVVCTLLIAALPLFPWISAPAWEPVQASSDVSPPSFQVRGFFTENLGQVQNDDVRFYTASGGMLFGFTPRSVLTVLHNPVQRTVSPYGARPAINGRPGSAVLVRITFPGSNSVVPEGLNVLPFPSHYFLGSEPSRWRVNVRSYSEVAYPNLYQGIDLVFRVSEHGVKYEFLVRPGARAEEIRVSYEGAKRLAVDASGNLQVVTSAGAFVDTSPAAWQGEARVSCRFRVEGLRSMRYACDPYNHGAVLVIDPLVYSTFLGGVLTEQAWDLTVDSSGDAFVTGYSRSPDFPVTPGAFDPSPNGGRDAFVAKLRETGSGLEYATYLGGAGSDWGKGIAVDAVGTVYITGTTTSPDFPTTPAAFDRTCGSDGTCDFDGTNYYPDGFVARMSATGDSLLYSTFLGGLEGDDSRSVTVDQTGDAYLTGDTHSRDFPTTPGAFDRTCGADGACDFDGALSHGDVFLTKVSPAGDRLEYSTFLGGGDDDTGASVAVDSGGSAFLTGFAQSDDFPTTPGVFQPVRGTDVWGDAFVTKVNPAGSALSYSTFLGGNEDADGGLALSLDASGNAYVAGTTGSGDFPTTPGAFDRSHNSPGVADDVFVLKLNSTGEGLLYSTLLGGSGLEGWVSLAVSADGEALIAGFTDSMTFPTTTGAFRRSGGGGNDAFLARVNVNASALLYSTFLGGQMDDFGWAVAVDASGDAYVAGATSSLDFPTTPGAFDGTVDGASDAFVLKFAPLPNLAVVEVSTVPGPPLPVGVPAAVAVNVTNAGDVDAGPVSVLAFEDRDGDDRFDPGEDLGVRDVPSLPVFASVVLSYPWTPDAPGPHRLCALADFLDLVREGNETDNLRCADVPAAVPVLGPDYAPRDPQPPSPLRVGLSVDMSLSARVANVGNGSANATATLAFFNASTPGSPFAAFPVPPLAADEASAPSVASWRSPSAPGTYAIVADVDHGDDLAEWDESNNAYAWTVDVVAGPVTTLVLGQPNVTAPQAYVTSATPLSFAVLDQSGAGIRTTGYRVDGPPWINYTATGPFTLTGEGPHLVEWWSEDFAGNGEAVQDRVVVVDDTPPTTALAIGDPKSTDGGTYVTSATPFALAASDGGVDPVGVGPVEYRIGTDPWRPYAAPFAIPGEGLHAVSFQSADRLGNAEPAQAVEVIVDDTPPTVSLAVGQPQHAGPPVFVASSTPLAVDATDGGPAPVGLASVQVRIGGGPWTPYAGPFTLAPPDGARRVEYAATDLLGHLAVGATDFVLDDTPPAISVDVGTPRHDGVDTFVTSATPLAIAAADEGLIPVGVASMEYRLGGPWIPYAGPFTLSGPDGPKTLEYRATDRLGNAATGQRTVILDDTPPATSLAVGEPKHVAADTYVTSATPLSLAAADGGAGGVGIAATEVRIDGGPWTPYGAPFSLVGAGAHAVAFRSTDRLGNEEPIRVLPFTVDDTPPITTPSPGDGTYPTGTAFAFPATDAGSGVARTEIRVDGGSWATYAVPLVLAEGAHTITFRSVDRVNNTEPELTLSVTIEGAPPRSPETNWKPLVAAIFAAVLALTGAWSARRAPWPRGSRPRSRAFVLTALPFVAAEVATGVLSLLTGLLAVPPLLGAGTAVDAGILIVGVALAVYRVRSRPSRETVSNHRRT